MIAAIALLREAIEHHRFVGLEKHLDLIERMLRECSKNCWQFAMDHVRVPRQIRSAVMRPIHG